MELELMINMATTRQQLALKKLSENIRKTGKKPVNIGAALRAAGYSESVCKSPQRVTQTKGWSELLDEYFPEDLVLEKHRALLESEDLRVVTRALDMAYRIRGSYKANTTIQITSKYENWSDEELDAELKRLEAELNINRPS